MITTVSIKNVQYETVTRKLIQNAAFIKILSILDAEFIIFILNTLTSVLNFYITRPIGVTSKYLLTEPCMTFSKASLCTLVPRSLFLQPLYISLPSWTIYLQDVLKNMSQTAWGKFSSYFSGLTLDQLVCFRFKLCSSPMSKSYKEANDITT